MENRKLDHIKICVEKNVEYGNAGFDKIELVQKSLPELDFGKINTACTFGKHLKYPFIIEAMTGGTPEAEQINKDLARVAQDYGIGFGVGSQRAAIEDPKLERTFMVRDVAPDIFLIANLGAVQLNYGYGIKECQRAVDMIDADALALHINPLQEVVQPGGNTDFSNLIKKINEIKKELHKPVIVKGVGSGVSYDIAKKLGVDAIDVGGLGGTSWALVESYRGNKALGEKFAGFGIPTAECVKELSKLKIPIVASGGIRSGIDAAKAIALGARCIGVALPILRAWNAGKRHAVREYLDQFFMEMKVAMFLTGAKTLEELKGNVRESNSGHSQIFSLSLP